MRHINKVIIIMIIMIMIFSLTISFQVLFFTIIYSINKHMLVRQCIVHTKTRHHAQRRNYANQVKQLYSNQAPACSRDGTASVMWHFCPLMFPLKSLLGSYKKGRNKNQRTTCLVCPPCKHGRIDQADQFHASYTVGSSHESGITTSLGSF